MITVEEAKARVLAQVVPVTETETLAVAQCLGRVLAQDAVAPDDVPNHANSGMDGFGVRLADLSSTDPVALVVVADLPAGDYREQPLQAGEAVRIMTGAPIPPGCDCVVMQEVVQQDGDRVIIPAGQKSGQNIRPAGEDLRRGDQVLAAGRRLGPAELGVLTSLGLVAVPVYRRIKVAVVSTGNEVVEPGTPLQPGQVYDSNRTALRAALTALGVEVIDLGLVRDDRQAIATTLARAGQEADAVISTGGVSVGDFDLVKEVLLQEGSIDFWQVAMKPGKPQAYGKLGRAAFFGLPGNPVSGLVVFLIVVRPALLKLMGASPEPERQCRLPFRGQYNKRHNRMDFIRGVVRFAADGAWVETTGPQGSGLLTSMARANALIVLPENPVQLQDGSLVDVRLIDYV